MEYADLSIVFSDSPFSQEEYYPVPVKEIAEKPVILTQPSQQQAPLPPSQCSSECKCGARDRINMINIILMILLAWMILRK